jgi:2,3,4,5-tetrahydropyridine-2-carboxylate N-succinyltransferase
MTCFFETALTNVQDFQQAVAQIEGLAGYRKPIGFGVCRIEQGQLEPTKILSCDFPCINWNENYGSAAVFLAAADGLDQCSGPELVVPLTKEFISRALNAFHAFVPQAQGDAHRNVQIIKILAQLLEAGRADIADYRAVFLFDDQPAQSVPVVYFKLMALSTGKAALRGLNLDGIFGKLENVAWVGNRPYELGYLRAHEIEMKLSGTYPNIDYVDKFPRYLMQVIPADNTRILDGGKVRFGAQLAAGTTVMPGASYINFNAGTLGPTMIEGRISSSAIVGANSDVGGGASILGVLSGGNSTPISVGEKCLLGVNSVTGIPLGHGCILDAGVALLAGTRVFIHEDALADIIAANPGWDLQTMAVKAHPDLKMQEFKAKSLSGGNGLHVRVDSATGRMMVARSKREIPLNAALH